MCWVGSSAKKKVSIVSDQPPLVGVFHRFLTPTMVIVSSIPAFLAFHPREACGIGQFKHNKDVQRQI
jgi:hypothetical protein